MVKANKMMQTPDHADKTEVATHSTDSTTQTHNADDVVKQTVHTQQEDLVTAIFRAEDTHKMQQATEPTKPWGFDDNDDDDHEGDTDDDDNEDNEAQPKPAPKAKTPNTTKAHTATATKPPKKTDTPEPTKQDKLTNHPKIQRKNT